MSSGWGAMSQKNSFTKNEDDENFTEIVGLANDEFDGDLVANTNKIQLTNKSKPFKYNIRLKGFLKAYLNCLMGQVLIKHGTETIVKIQTDGFVSTKKMNFKVTNLLPDAKYTGINITF